MTSVLELSRKKCLSPWKRHNFPAPPNIELTLSHRLMYFTNFRPEKSTNFFNIAKGGVGENRNFQFSSQTIYHQNVQNFVNYKMAFFPA